MMAGRWQVLIAHAEDEEEVADQLAEPIRAAGYDVAHRGTVLVGESIIADASKILSLGGPVVVCATITAVGTGWANDIVQAARHRGAKVFVVRMQARVRTDHVAADEVVAEYWKDPEAAMRALIEALQKHYPLLEERAVEIRASNRRQRALDRYRVLALESYDIVDLNLLAGDRHLVTRTLELRRLYVSLRVHVEVENGGDEIESNESSLARIEMRRSASRLRAAGWGADPFDEPETGAVPIGERLGKTRRVVVLGDPGAGKTTLLRWLATAYLLRLKHDPAFKELPDVSTLPDEDWLPILIRCRDLDTTNLQGALDGILRDTLFKMGMSEDETHALRGALRDELEAGRALLLVDGLDEIVDPRARAAFCEQIEQIHTAFRNTPIIVTSRVVGYREMGYRIGRGFDHVTVADLDASEKDDFARRWCTLTEPVDRRQRATDELIKAIHSSERIERLTGNAMLLTTTAIVKRQVGDLPSRRAELYDEAVKVLLRWRSERDAPLDPEETLPQLEYLGYSMCDRGVQRLREGELIEILDQMRREYPHLRRAAKRSPEEFLRLLERRTGLVVETGREPHEGIEVPVFEFRHLTFQEYMAGRALAYGRFPNPDRESRDTVVARLAGQTTVDEDQGEIAVPENWREALRLCIGCRRDREDIDATLLAILKARDGENTVVTQRPRSVLATECLADEPSVRESTALTVMQQFVACIHADEGASEEASIVRLAALELASSEWSRHLEEALVKEFIARPSNERIIFGDIAAEVCRRRHQKNPLPTVLSNVLDALQSGDEEHAVVGGLHLMQMAYDDVLDGFERTVTEAAGASLMAMLGGSAAVAHAASWALGWMSTRDLWTPNQADQRRLLALISDESTDPQVVFWSMDALERFPVSDEAIIKRLSDPSAAIRRKAVAFVAASQDLRGLDALIQMARRHDDDGAILALGSMPDIRAAQVLWERLVSDPSKRYACAHALALSPVHEAKGFLRDGILHSDSSVRLSVVRAISATRDTGLNKMILGLYGDPNREVRRQAMKVFASTCSDQVDRRILSRDLDSRHPWLDPQVYIDDKRVSYVAKMRNLPLEDVRKRYERLANRFPLRLAWAPEGGNGIASSKLSVEDSTMEDSSET